MYDLLIHLVIFTETYLYDFSIAFRKRGRKRKVIKRYRLHPHT